MGPLFCSVNRDHGGRSHARVSPSFHSLHGFVAPDFPFAPDARDDTARPPSRVSFRLADFLVAWVSQAGMQDWT